MDVEVRQATTFDRAKIGTFLEEGFPNRYRYPERWAWLNIHNPFIPDAFGLPEWIAIVNGQIVGHWGSMLVPVKMGERFMIAGWGIDAFVSPTTRGLGIGKRLQAANQSAHRLVMSFEMTPSARAVKQKLGHQEGPSVSLLYRMERFLPLPLYQQIGSAVQRHLGIRENCWEFIAKRTGLMQASCWILKKMIKARQHNTMITSENLPLTLKPVTRFDEKADTLWATIRSRYTFAIERTSMYLNWKYRDQPHMHHKCFYIMENGAVQGILVIRRGELPEPPIGVICECFLREPTMPKYSWVIQKAVTQLNKQGVAGIWAATANPEFEMVLHEQGFLRIQQELMMLHVADGSYPGKYSQVLLGKADHDWDQFPNLRQPYLRQFIKMASGRRR